MHLRVILVEPHEAGNVGAAARAMKNFGFGELAIVGSRPQITSDAAEWWAKGGLEVVKSMSAAMTLDLLHREAELVGREIKNHLDAAGIRERHSVVGIPAAWVMSQHTKVPELSPEDMVSFLQIEAEKGFPVDPAQLQIARPFQRSGGETYVTQLAVRREQVNQLTMRGFIASKPRLTIEVPRVYQSGDVALLISKFTMTSTGADGKQESSSGQGTEVVRRQADGTWRFLIDNPNGLA